MFREVTPVSYISLKTDRMDYRERCWKTIRSNVAQRRVRRCYGGRGDIFENWPDTLFVNL